MNLFRKILIFIYVISGCLVILSSAEIKSPETQQHKLSRHRRFIAASTAGWVVGVTMVTTIPTDPCVFKSNCTTSTGTLTFTFPLTYTIDTGVAASTGLVIASSGSLPYSLPGTYTLSLTLPFTYLTSGTGRRSTGAFWDNPLENLQYYADNPLALLTAPDFSPHYEYIDNNDPSYASPYQQHYQHTDNAIDYSYAYPVYDEYHHRYPRSSGFDFNNSSKKPDRETTPSQSILAREVQRLNLISGIQKSLEVLDSQWWQRHEGQEPFFEDMDACLKRALCETAQTPDAEDFISELLHMLMVPKELLKDLPPPFKGHQFIKAQADGAFSNDCSKHIESCDIPAFEINEGDSIKEIEKLTERDLTEYYYDFLDNQQFHQFSPSNFQLHGINMRHMTV